MINTLDRNAIALLRKDLDAALSAVAAKHGIVLKTGNCRFSPTAAKMSLEIATVTGAGVVMDLETSCLRANLRYLGFTEEILSRKFRLGTKTFTLKGYKKARYAKPFSLNCLEDGKTYVASEMQVRAALGLTATR